MSKPIIYIDSCCFIDVVKHKVGVLPKDINDDVWFVQKLLEAHYAGDVRLITSFLTIAKCVSVEKGQSKVPDEIQKQFRSLLTSGQYVILVQQTPNTAIVAQDLRWKHELVVSGADALHLAAAIENNAHEFLTTDERLKKPKLAKAINVLSSLGIAMVNASNTNCLPIEYRQEEANV